MGKYKIKVNIELVECDDAEELGVTKEGAGSLTMTISGEDAKSIDKCERAVLEAAHPTIREALSKHLSEISKKGLLKKANQEEK
jgi:hypothetical protein